MDWPDLLPSELDYCRALTDEAQILPLLSVRSDEHLMRFFEAASDDEGWTNEHTDTMRQLLQWLSTEFAARRLATRYGQRIVQRIHEHPATLTPLLPKDLELRVKDFTLHTSSLLYAVLSPFFCNLIERSFISHKPFQFTFADVPADFLRTIDEYMNTGVVENLWRWDQAAIVQFLIQAGLWQIDSLEEFTTQVVKRYINRHTIADFIELAQRRNLRALKQVCAEMLNQMPLGLQLVADDVSLRLIIEELMDPAQPILSQIAPIITHLGLRRQTAESLEVRRLLTLCSKLIGIDLEGSTTFPQELIHRLQTINDLNLASCTWLTNPILEQFLTRFPYLHALNLSENTQLTFEGFRKVGDQKDLERLVCVYCTGLEDDVLEMIARGCSSLVDLNISWCSRITDRGIRSLGTMRPALRSVDISHCVTITDIGLHDLIRPCYQLQHLTMQHLPLVSEDGIASVPVLCPNLQSLDVRLCHLGATQAQALRQRYARLELIL